MHCDPLINPICIVPRLLQSASGAAAGGVLGGIAQAIMTGVRWIGLDHRYLVGADPVPRPGVRTGDHPDAGLAAADHRGRRCRAVIAAGLRMTIARRANPLLDVTGGLLTMAAAMDAGHDGPISTAAAGTATAFRMGTDR